MQPLASVQNSIWELGEKVIADIVLCVYNNNVLTGEWSVVSA